MAEVIGPIKYKRVLVTGATGVIGRHAVRALRLAGYDVYMASRAEGDGIHQFQVDILDRKAISSVFRTVRPNCLLHLAWDVSSGEYLKSNKNFSWISASLDLLQFFQENGGTRAVFAGTCLEYAMTEKPLREDDALAPATVYAFCKDRLNQLAGFFCAKNGISYGWGRVFYLYGAGERMGRLTSDLVHALRSGEKMVVKGGPLIRDYTYAGDIGAAFAHFLLSPVEGNVNICSGYGVAIRDYCRLLASLLGHEELLVFQDDIAMQPPVIVGANDRLRSEVGFLAQTDLKTGFSAMLAEYDASAKR